MLKEQKERVVEQLAQRLRDSDTLMVADYRGLTMPEIDELRSRLLEAGARFTVVKNTLTRRAAEAAGRPEVLDLIDGPTAIAFLSPEGDPAAVAKVLNDTAKTNDVLVIRGGVLEGTVVGDVEIKRLATLPPADVLRAQLVGAIAGPLTTVVGLFAAPLRDLVGVLDARIRQLEEQGETAQEPEAEAAPEAPAQEPPAEEPAAEEPPAEEPAAEEPVAEEAPQEETEEPSAGETAPEAEQEEEQSG
jgi:large subunit ribosomal protein L10